MSSGLRVEKGRLWTRVLKAKKPGGTGLLRIRSSGDRRPANGERRSLFRPAYWQRTLQTSGDVFPSDAVPIVGDRDATPRAVAIGADRQVRLGHAFFCVNGDGSIFR